MPKYIVLKMFELEGVNQEAGTEVELTEEVAAQLVIDKTVELVADQAADATA